MGELIIAGTVFLTTHLGISSGLRGAILRHMNERSYLALYSLVAIAALVYLIYAFSQAPGDRFLWLPTRPLYWVPIVTMPFALSLLVGGFMTRNPTAVGQESQLTETGSGRGMLRITRHPFQWAVIIWAAGHIIANGDAASVIFFGTFGVVSFVGTFLMDSKKADKLGSDWAQFASVTSNVPFVAIAAARNRFAISELALPVLVGLVLYAVLFWAHPWIAGVPLAFA
jgi:uncharacterized membrane protein